RQLRVYADSGQYYPAPEWSENLSHPIEQNRGQIGSGDGYSPGWFDLLLKEGSEVTLVLTAEEKPDAQPKRSGAGNAPVPAEAALDHFGQMLRQAARAFVVRRDEAVTVIAGYPWFLDWGRDSLICARGLLAAGMTAEVRQLLTTFARF